MRLFRTPYDTTYGASYNVNKIALKLEEYVIKFGHALYDYEFINTDKVKSVFITGRDHENDLPVFNHPIVVVSTDGKTYVFSDVRSHVKLEDLSDKLMDAARNSVNLHYEVMRNILICTYLEKGIDEYKPVFNTSARIFTAWISGALSRVLNLDLSEKSRLNLIIAAHYYNIFSQKPVESDNDRDLATHVCSKVTGVAPTLVRQVTDLYDFESVTMDSLVRNIRKIMNNPKTDNLTANALVSFISSTWFGPNSTEAIPISLEYVPQWLSVLAISLQERTFKRTMIFESAKAVTKSSELKDFVSLMDKYVKEKMI